jgi:hypothetical protein
MGLESGESRRPRDTPDSVAGLRGFEPSNVRLKKCLAHQQNLVALPKRFEARSAIAFCEFESSLPSHEVGLRKSRFAKRLPTLFLYSSAASGKPSTCSPRSPARLIGCHC